MEIAFYIVSGLLFLVSFLPRINHPHWLFRIWDFGKIQITLLLIIVLTAGFFITASSNFIYIILALLSGTILYHMIVLSKYTALYKKAAAEKIEASSQTIKIVSANVYQWNADHHSFLKLIQEMDPDIFLIMESNMAWENALKPLEKDYPNCIKVPLENTYGMHFYSKLKIEKETVHYYVAEDIPCIEAHCRTNDGYEFVFFGVHPPPPSPTEEETSRERDGDLLSVAKEVQNIPKPVFVIGDFNNVAWSNSSILFKKKSELIDSRIGRGFFSTYHAKYKLLRFPIDLMFHSEEIFIEKLQTLRYFGSDHLPVYCEFYINNDSTVQDDEIEKADAEEEDEVEEIIKDGKEEGNDRKAVAEEY